jgi:arylsulfatase A-like enzyme/Tfp pilus assembly protein PilF
MKARFQCAVLLVAAVAAVGAARGAEDNAGPPSVLLVTLDTTRADHLGCFGAEFASTPHLDALAQSGVRFDQAISPAPLTLPTHASIFTGLVPRRHGVRNNASFRLGAEPAVLAEALRRHGYRTAAFVSSAVLDRITGLDRGFEHYDDTVRVGPREAFNHEERAASQTNDAVFAHLDRLDEPFFLWVHYFDPHLPYVPPEPFRARFPDRPYDGEIAFMDDRFGDLLDTIRSKVPALLVVVAGDHGESLGEHGENAHGIFVYQATQRVPLIMAGPGLPPGKVVGDPVGLVDLAPTVLDLLGLPPLPDIDGRSVAPLVRGEERPPANYELESLFPTYAYGWLPVRGLVRDRFKLVRSSVSELYRLDVDPDEKTDLARAEEEIAGSMAEDLGALTDGDEPPAPAPDPDLAEHRHRLEALGYVSGGDAPGDGEAIDPRDGVAWIADLEAGRKAYQTGNPAEGIVPLKRLLSRNPRNVPALLALAMCYLGTGQVARAVEADRRALEIRPDDDLVHFNLANALSALGDEKPEARDEARVHYARALELNPRFADVYLNYASFLEREADDPGALSLLRRARAAGVQDPHVEIRIAVLSLKTGEVEAAKAAFRRALHLHPRDPGPLEAMARIAYRQGAFAESAEYYERLLETAPDADTARTLGSIRLEKLGDRAGAREAFARALELTPPEDPSRKALRDLLNELAADR